MYYVLSDLPTYNRIEYDIKILIANELHMRSINVTLQTCMHIVSVLK